MKEPIRSNNNRLLDEKLESFFQSSEQLMKSIYARCSSKGKTAKNNYEFEYEVDEEDE